MMAARGRSDWPWRLAALLVAVILWLAVGRQGPYSHQRTFVVPISIRRIPAGKTATVDPDQVAIRVTGDLATLNAITADDILAYVDLRDQSNRQSVPIVVSLPTDVAVNDMLPERVRVTVRPAGRR